MAPKQDDVFSESEQPELDPVEAATQRVAEATAALREAQEAHDLSETAQALEAAKADHAAAVEEHAGLTKEPDALYGEHILVDFVGSGDYVQRDLPVEDKRAFAASGYPRRLFVDGQNVEQVGNHDSGVRLYRKM